MTDEIKNIPGEFIVTLDGKERTIKATFGAVEKLEGGLLGKTIFEALNDAMNGRVRYADVISVIMVGLEAFNRDTRMTREEIGNAVFAVGLTDFLATHIEFLTYCLTGGKKPKAGAKGEA